MAKIKVLSDVLASQVAAGEVVERGSHDVLLERGGRYSAMWARQASEEDVTDIAAA